jgi:hypothetical protein
LQDTFDAIESHRTNPELTRQTLSNWQASLDDIFENLCERAYGAEEIRQSRDFLQSLRLSDEEQCTKTMSLTDASDPIRQSGSQWMALDISVPITTPLKAWEDSKITIDNAGTQYYTSLRDEKVAQFQQSTSLFPTTSTTDFDEVITLSSIPNMGHPGSSSRYPLSKGPMNPKEPRPPPNLENIEGFIQSSFPFDNFEHFDLRMKLREVMISPWKLNNEEEPDGEILLQFSKKSEDNKWHCLFHRDSKPCEGATAKKEHAKNHIRAHINHLPSLVRAIGMLFILFTAPLDNIFSPRSTGTGYTKRYCSPEALQKHLAPVSKCPSW